MRTLLMTLLLFSVTNCQNASSDLVTYDAGHYPQIDRELIPEVENFLVDCGYGPHWNDIQWIRFDVTRDQESPHRVGYCETSPSGARRIAISPGLLERPWFFKATVYHEASHCLLDRKHVDDPDSLMAPSMTHDESWYRDHWTELVTDLCPK